MKLKIQRKFIVSTVKRYHKYHSIRSTKTKTCKIVRSRWVEYDQGIHTVYETSVIEPGWALWLRYGVDVPPSEMTAEELPVRAYPMPERHQPNLTFTRGAYVPYNTAKPKVQGWAPQVRDRA